MNRTAVDDRSSQPIPSRPARRRHALMGIAVITALSAASLGACNIGGKDEATSTTAQAPAADPAAPRYYCGPLSFTTPLSHYYASSPSTSPLFLVQ